MKITYHQMEKQMLSTLTIFILLVVTFTIYKIYSNAIEKEKLETERWQELREAEQALQDLKDKKQVANIDLSAAELENKIEKLKLKINKESKKHV